MKKNGRVLRHEQKYYINEDTVMLLRSLLAPLMKVDENSCKENGYLVSSIYFDDIYHSAMHEKIAGVANRKKFRIRSYDLDNRKIKLECKEKYDQYISKRSVNLSITEYEEMLEGNYEVLRNRTEGICREFYVYTKTKLLHPVVVVEYTREAFVEKAGNVRITFDKEIAASMTTMDIFSEDYITTRVLKEGKVVLEVKYDDFLPEHIRQVIGTINTQQCAISKYVMCRENKREVKHI